MKLKKQTALKAALLLALAANTSWNVHRMNSTELAATGESVPTQGADSAPTADPGAPGSKPPENIVVRARIAAAPVPAKVQPDAQAKPVPEKKTSLPFSEEDVKVCGDDYVVLYKEIQAENQTWTEVHFKTKGAANWEGSLTRLPNGLITYFAKKSELDGRVTRAIKGFREDRKMACAGETKAAENVTTAALSAEEKEKAERIKKGVKECKVDTDGKKLSRSGQLECWMSRLAVADDLEQDKSKTKRSSRYGDDDRDDDKAILANIKTIARDKLRPLIKEMILSKDGSDREDAIEAASEAAKTILELGRTNRLGGTRKGGYNNDISKLVGEMEGLAQGGKTVAKTEEYEDDARDVRDRVRAATEEFKRDPLNPYVQNEYNMAQMNFRILADHINSDIGMSMIGPLQSYRSAGFISSKDFSDYTQPFMTIRRLLMNATSTDSLASSSLTRPTGAITSSLLGSDFQIPINMSVVRSSGGAGALRSGGFTLPTTAPSLSFPKTSDEFSLTSGRTVRLGGVN